MADSPTTHYLNADFDLSLRPRPRQLSQPNLVRQVRELSVQALLGADRSDSVLLRAEVPAEFLEHLDRCGLPVPTLLTHLGLDPATRFQPFGWNAEAAELNRAHRHPVEHPDLGVVRRVNGRSFALALENELAGDTPRGAAAESPAELVSILHGAPADTDWVIKSEHGNAGLANRRVDPSALQAADRRFIEERFKEDDRLLVEPWLPRVRDWSVVFDTPFDPRTFRVHEALCTADGGLIGSLFEPGAGGAAPWLDELGAMAERVATALDREGYFGPVCVDAFTWRDGQRLRLRPLVDLNCRLSLSHTVHRLWRRIAPQRTLLYRFFNRRKIDFPGKLPEALAALGEHSYDRGSCRGILLASPLRLGSTTDHWRPGKLAFLFFADGRAETAELEHWFRERFEV